VGGDGDSVTSRIKKATEELDAMQSEIAAEIESLGDFETAKALELSLLEMYNRSVEELQNEEHIIVIPILSLRIDACSLVLKDPGLTRAI
jgi:tRNA (Thr-GGU) A37 N-methylase